MTALKWWAAPVNIGDVSDLRRLDQYFVGEVGFRPAEPMTVRFRGVDIREDEDWLSFNRNDLVIVSTFQFADEPPVQRLHFMRQNVPLGWHDDFFNDVVLSVREIKSRILTIRIQVYDVDIMDRGLIDDVQEAAQHVSTSVAIAFPQIAPYAGAVGFAVPAFMSLLDNLAHHDRILDERIKLEVTVPSSGFKVLQPGYYVCFKQPVDEGLRLNRDLRVVHGDGTPFEDFSYAVLGITREHYAYVNWEITQKIAKLVSELNGGGTSGKAALEFLRETMEGYQKYKKLVRAQELMTAPSRSDPENALLEELLKDPELSPFLLTV